MTEPHQPNGPRAYAPTTALHEAIRAFGFTNEAKTTCYAVQLVPVAGNTGLNSKKTA